MPEVSLACLSSWAPRSPALPDPPINATTSGSSSIYSTTTSSAGSTSTQKLVAAAFAATAIPLLGSGV
ncbi:hypothetical protein VFPFJ_02882 [Purpureocillium lilacinum]|nr:hypothetical protein VFPFJ_02882 [Purpureocillium lilacinum]OAQ93720.1 hypothetical protein VFPFJ_02882 [Purpureocillium lilacinum]